MITNYIIEEITDYKLNIDNFIAIDFETTGLNPNKDRIIEIGAIRFRNNLIVDKFETLVKIDIDNSHSAMEINHISNEMLRNAPDELEAFRNFIDFLNDDSYVVGHNIKSFDIKFLKNALDRLNLKINLNYIDTLQLSKLCVFDVNNYKLDTLLSKYNIKNNNPHRALSDSLSCGLLYLKLKEINT